MFLCSCCHFMIFCDGFAHFLRHNEYLFGMFRGGFGLFFKVSNLAGGSYSYFHTSMKRLFSNSSLDCYKLLVRIVNKSVGLACKEIFPLGRSGKIARHMWRDPSQAHTHMHVLSWYFKGRTDINARHCGLSEERFDVCAWRKCFLWKCAFSSKSITSCFLSPECESGLLSFLLNV